LPEKKGVYARRKGNAGRSRGKIPGKGRGEREAQPKPLQKKKNRLVKRAQESPSGKGT